MKSEPWFQSPSKQPSSGTAVPYCCGHGYSSRCHGYACVWVCVGVCSKLRLPTGDNPSPMPGTNQGWGLTGGGGLIKAS